jgi:hypothetical protein
MEKTMGRSPTDTIEELNIKGDFQYRTLRSGWLGTDSYTVEATVTHRDSKKAELATNDNPYESPRSVRQRALEQLLEKL